MSGVDRQWAAAARRPHWAAGAVVYAAAGFVVAFFVWANFAELDQVVSGGGRVIPSGQVRVVQNLEGGIVRDILARDGAQVAEGDVLLRLDPTQATASFRGDRAAFLGFNASRARLMAEIDGGDPDFPQVVRDEAPHLIASENALMRGRRAELDASVDILRRQVEQRRQELRELESRANSLARGVALAEEELRITEPNVAAGVTSRVELLRLQREATDLRGQLEETRLSIPRARSALAESQRRVSERTETFRAEALDRLSVVEVELAARSENLVALEDQVRRTEVRAPVDGVVSALAVNTIGEVVQPGAMLAEILPAAETLLVEARIKPEDIAFLFPGQTASVKLTAYDFTIYGDLDGAVERIGADAVVPDDGESFYRIQVR
ncbi:MAG: HlyD family type I secretion periplasmic adaptor subunit, partial [Pseudomonadota bacterium]